MIRRLVLVGLFGICGVMVGQTGLTPWQQEALTDLSVRYLGSGPETLMSPEQTAVWVDRLARDIGGRLAESGVAALPAEDPAAFSPFNDIATDQSVYNEGLARGNVYLGKAYFQQEYRFGTNLEYALLGQVGIVDFSDFFDTNMFANNEVRQFLNSSFVNAAAYKTAIGAPGVVGEFRPNWNKGWIGGATVRAGYAVARTGKMFQSPIWNAELELGTRLAGRTGRFDLADRSAMWRISAASKRSTPAPATG